MISNDLIKVRRIRASVVTWLAARPDENAPQYAVARSFRDLLRSRLRRQCFDGSSVSLIMTKDRHEALRQWVFALRVAGTTPTLINRTEYQRHFDIIVEFIDNSIVVRYGERKEFCLADPNCIDAAIGWVLSGIRTIP